MVISISEEEFLRMKGVILDGDRNEAFRLIKVLVEKLEQKMRHGVNTHI